MATGGNYTFYLQATDNAGTLSLLASIANNAGRGDSPSWKFTVDTVSPTVVLTATAGSGRNIALSWLGSDASPSSGNLTYDVQYKQANGAFTGWLTGTTVLSTSLSGLPGYTYTFQIRVKDRAGNVSAWQSPGPVLVEKVTKYYSFGASRVAMRRGSVVYYLHGDHPSTLPLVAGQVWAAPP